MIFRFLPTAITFIAILVWVPFAGAVVQSIDATVVAEVQQFVDGQELNSDYAFEALDQTTGNLPLIVVAELPGEEGQQNEKAGAVASTYFYDPRLSTGPDPDEFGLDVAVFSLLDNVFYQGHGQVTETRRITFTEDEIGRAAGTALEARSFFFLDGYITLWTDAEHLDLSGTMTEVMLSVEQIRNEQSEKVLEARILLEGRADGSVVLTADGALSVDHVVLTDMSHEVSELGRVHTVVVPDIAIPYFYPAKVEESFDLKANISVRAYGQPMTGASVALGFPLPGLSELFQQVTGELLAGEQFQQSLNEAVDNSPPPARPLKADTNNMIWIVDESSTARLLPPLCGGMAAELAFVLVGLTLMRVIQGGGRRAAQRIGR